MYDGAWSGEPAVDTVDERRVNSPSSASDTKESKPRERIRESLLGAQAKTATQDGPRATAACFLPLARVSCQFESAARLAFRARVHVLAGVPGRRFSLSLVLIYIHLERGYISSQLRADARGVARRTVARAASRIRRHRETRRLEGEVSLSHHAATGRCLLLTTYRRCQFRYVATIESWNSIECSGTRPTPRSRTRASYTRLRPLCSKVPRNSTKNVRGSPKLGAHPFLELRFVSSGRFGLWTVQTRSSKGRCRSRTRSIAFALSQSHPLSKPNGIFNGIFAGRRSCRPRRRRRRRASRPNFGVR